MAIFYYFALCVQVLSGMIPRGSGDPAKFYRENAGFFWTYISIFSLIFLYQISRGSYLYWKRLRHDTDPAPPEKSFTPKTAAVITSIVAIPLGLLLLILPVVELVKQTAYGGYALGNHPLATDAVGFWGVLIFQVLLALAPIVGAILLFIFPPRHTDPVSEFVLEPSASAPIKPGMKTLTKVLIGSVVGLLLIGVLGVGAIVGGVYYVYRKVDDPELRKKSDAAKIAGAEFAKNVDQEGCMNKAYTLDVPADTFDMSNHYFTKSCLKASRPTPGFCDGVPFTMDRDWFQKQCDVADRSHEACIAAYTAKRDFCRLD